MTDHMKTAKDTDYEQVRVGFTDRQEKVVQLKNQGYTHEEIADRLGISPRTSETHLYNARQIVEQYVKTIETIVGDLDEIEDDETLKQIRSIVCEVQD